MMPAALEGFVASETERTTMLRVAAPERDVVDALTVHP